MSEWMTMTLAEAGVELLDCIHKTPAAAETGYPYIAIPQMKNGNLDLSDARIISEADYEEWTKKVKPQAWDIVLSRRCNPGVCAYVPEGLNFALGQNLVLLRSNGIFVLPTYLRYIVKSREWWCEVSKYLNVGSIFDSLRCADVPHFMVSFPPISEQKAIAAVLSSLDDKIDLLHRQNKTLEAMAETLFKQWFVVEAKETLEEKPLSKVANFLNGLACQKYPPENEIDKLPVLKIRELSSGISESSDWASSDIKPEYIVENGDVIFAWSASLMVKIWHGKKCILNQHLFKVTSEEYPKWFYFMWCKHHLDEFISISSSHATTMGHIKRGDLDNAMVLIPTDDELKMMSSEMTPILNKQIANQKQIQTLETLLDNLLPKLMSGEVRVKTG